MVTPTITTALTNMGSVLSHVVNIITSNDILLTMFAAGLFQVAIRVFRKLARAASHP